MNTNQNLVIRKSSPYTSYGRRQTDWSKLSNANLKFMFDVLSAHRSPFECDVVNEIERRISAGIWLDLNSSPPPLENIPAWLKKWPFCLFWKQRVK